MVHITNLKEWIEYVDQVNTENKDPKSVLVFHIIHLNFHSYLKVLDLAC